LLLNGLGAVFWTVQYIMLGAFTGAVTEILVGIRSVLSAYMTDTKHKHMAAAVFVPAFIAGGLWVYRQPYDIINIVACICGTISMIYFTDFRLRFGIILATALWAIYNGLVGSAGGLLAGITLVVTQIITLLRMYQDRKRDLTQAA
jgi:hypothetical protein